MWIGREGCAANHLERIVNMGYGYVEVIGLTGGGQIPTILKINSISGWIILRSQKLSNVSIAAILIPSISSPSG